VAATLNPFRDLAMFESEELAKKMLRVITDPK
jgi:hypothetical protein